MPSRLSKSRVLQGLQCHRQLWWRVREPDAPELAADPAQQALFDEGREVGEVARTYVPGGVLVDRDALGIPGALEATRAAIANGARVLYEAAFAADGVFAAVDVLERTHEGWVLVEVKSSTQVKDVHVCDVAVQLHVLRAAGLDVRRVEVMTLDRACVHPDLSNLFARRDVTAEAQALAADLPAAIRAQEAMLARALPDVEPGEQCDAPYRCPFHARCNPPLPRHHVSTLYYGGKRARAWAEAGCETVLDIPDDADLTPVQRRQVRAVAAGRLVCDPGLDAALRALEAPFGYLDFETLGPAIPRWPGCRPYDAVPAQFVHALRVAGAPPIVTGHLAEGGEDPRPELARRLVEACRPARTVLAWYARFERERIQELAAAVPELGAELEDLAHRVVDLLPLVREHVYHPDFGGGFRLKDVLPVLVPELSYEGLAIREGGAASVALARLVLCHDALAPGEREALRGALEAYCRVDTLGVLRLHDRLVELARAAP